MTHKATGYWPKTTDWYKMAVEQQAEIDRLRAALPGILAQLRHAYMQLKIGAVKDQKQFADGLIAPQIRKLEQITNEEDNELSEDEMNELDKMDELDLVIGKLTAAALQISPKDDQIIADHIRNSVALLLQYRQKIRQRLEPLIGS